MISRNRSVGGVPKFMLGNIIVFSVTGLLGNFARSMVFPYASLYIMALDGDAKTIGLVNFLRPLSGLILFPIAGYLADRKSRIKMIVLSNYLSVAFILMYVLAPRWEVVAFAALLQGTAVVGFPPRSALIADSLSPEDRGRGIATMSTISSILSVFAPYLAGVMVDIYGPNTGVRMLYGVMMFLYFSAALIHFRFLKETVSDTGERITVYSLASILRTAYSDMPTLLKQLPRSAKALAGVIVLSFMANGVASPFWVVYATERIGLSPSRWGLILLCEAALRIIMFIPGGYLVDHWGRTASLFSALLLSLASVLLFVFTSNFTGVLCVRFIIGIASAISIPSSTALMADMIPRKIRAQVMSVLGQGGFMIGAAGGGTGGPGVGVLVTIPLMMASLAGGYLYAQNPVYPWVFVLIVTIVSIVLTALFIRDMKRAEI